MIKEGRNKKKTEICGNIEEERILDPTATIVILKIYIFLNFRMTIEKPTSKMRWKREDLMKLVEAEVTEDTDAIADKTGLQPWLVLLIVSIILISLVGLTVFCIIKFCAKKRSKKGEVKKSQDEQGLVEGEEEVDVLEEEIIQVRNLAEQGSNWNSLFSLLMNILH